MRTIDGRAWWYLALIAALPVLGYQFGIGNQVEQFTLVRRLADPSFLAGDFYVDSAAQFGPRWYYSLFLSWLTRIAPLAGVVFVLTYVVNLALAAVSFDAARRHLGAGPVGGAIAALIVIANASFALGFAGYLRFESFQPANPAIALSLIGFSLLLAGRRLWSAPAFAVAALLHPLIGVEIAAIAFGSAALGEAVRARRPGAILKAWLAYVPAGLLFGAAVFAAWVLPGLGKEAAVIPDAEFFHILAELRAPHHYLATEMPREQFPRAFAFIAAFALLAGLHLRESRLSFAPVAIAASGVIVLGLCAASVVLVDVLELRAFVTAQLFRMLMVLKWAGFLFFAARASVWLSDRSVLSWVGAAAPVLVTGEAQPWVLLASVIVVEAARRMKAGAAIQLALAAVLAAFSARYMLTLGAWEEFGRAVIGLGVLVAFFALGRRLVLMAGASLAMAGLIAFGVANRELGYDFRSDIFEPTYVFSDLKDPASETARWAKTNTPADAVFITPPDFESFRLIAERAVVADFTSIPFQDAAMREWRDRMTALYGEVDGGGFAALSAMRRNHLAADPERLAGAAERFGADFAVLYAETPWPGEVLYANADYKVVRLERGAP